MTLSKFNFFFKYSLFIGDIVNRWVNGKEKKEKDWKLMTGILEFQFHRKYTEETQETSFFRYSEIGIAYHVLRIRSVTKMIIFPD